MVFSQSAWVSVFDTTYFGVAFICLVIGSLASAFGQKPANSSYVRRPSSMASLPAMSEPTALPISSLK